MQKYFIFDKRQNILWPIIYDVVARECFALLKYSFSYQRFVVWLFFRNFALNLTGAFYMFRKIGVAFGK